MPPTDPPTPEENPTARAEGVPAEAGTIEPKPLRPDIQGQPITVDGVTWLLCDAGLTPALTELRDRVYDMSVIRGQVQLADLMACAFLMLTANYRNTNEQVREVLWKADPDELAQAVSAALFGPLNIRRTYTAWARSALLANGIKPTSISPAELPHVLNQLVTTGRAIPIERFTEADEAMSRRASLLNFDRD